MVTVQFLAPQSRLALAVIPTEPLPVPEFVDKFIHSQELNASQLHPLPALTTTDVPPPAPDTDQLAGLIVKLAVPAA